LTLEQWKAEVLAWNVTAKFTVEPPEDDPESGRTYGEPGDCTAHVGPDMQADVVGVYTAEGYWWYTRETQTPHGNYQIIQGEITKNVQL
jgi:hypothetical protein